MKIDRAVELLIREPYQWRYLQSWGSWFYPEQFEQWLRTLFGEGDISSSTAGALHDYLTAAATLDPAIAAKASATFLDRCGIPHELPVEDRIAIVRVATQGGVRMHASLAG